MPGVPQSIMSTQDYLRLYSDGRRQGAVCKRAIEPRYGKWTLPAGFMENRETTEEGAARKCGKRLRRAPLI